LHARACRRDRTASRRLRRPGRGPLRHAPPAGGDDDVLHAVPDQLQPRAFHRRRDGRLCDGGQRPLLFSHQDLRRIDT
jgi:hypothetical protein